MLVNAQLLAEGWNSPRATVCMHLAPTASKRIYQQRVGRVTRRHPGKEAGIVVDFVHPATKHDDPVVTLHSLLDRDVYRGGAIVVGPVRRGRGRRLRVERRVLPVTADENRRIEVFERELWRIAVEHLDYGEQVQWAALAGARVAPAGWRRARAMLHFDQGGELKRTFLITAVDRNKNAQLRLRALQEIAASRDAEAFDRALDFVESWPREDKREGVKVVLQALAEKKIGRRDQANNWIWRCANMTREVHEEYAVQRWPETKRLLGLLVNSSGGAHARNARRLVHAARQQDRRLSAALLAAAIPHTAEAGEVINGARTRMSRKPAALARELLRNFPKGKGRRGTRRRKRKGAAEGVAPEAVLVENGGVLLDGDERETVEANAPAKPRRTRRRRTINADSDSPLLAAAAAVEAAVAAEAEKPAKPAAKRPAKAKPAASDRAKAPAKRRRTAKPKPVPATEVVADVAAAEAVAAEPSAPAKPAKRRRTAKPKPEVVAEAAAAEAVAAESSAPAEAGEAPPHGEGEARAGRGAPRAPRSRRRRFVRARLRGRGRRRFVRARQGRRSAGPRRPSRRPAPSRRSPPRAAGRPRRSPRPSRPRSARRAAARPCRRTKRPDRSAARVPVRSRMRWKRGASTKDVIDVRGGRRRWRRRRRHGAAGRRRRRDPRRARLPRHPAALRRVRRGGFDIPAGFGSGAQRRAG